MQLYFIRHAQSANNRLYDETGTWNGRDTDPDLTDVGHEQSRRLAEHVACMGGVTLHHDYVNRSGFGFTHLYSSLMLQVQRAQRFVHDLMERHGSTDDRVAVVSHGGFYNLVLAVLLGIQADNGFWFGLNNTGITRLNFVPEGIGLAYTNRLEHLPAELIT